MGYVHDCHAASGQPVRDACHPHIEFGKCALVALCASKQYGYGAYVRKDMKDKRVFMWVCLCVGGVGVGMCVRERLH